MPIIKSVKTLVDEALSIVRTYSLDEARALHGQADVQFIDLRDPRELEREGVMPGAFHATRGMLEFWADPESPYHKPVFNQPGKRFVLFCAGGWRSALAARTLVEMGMDNVGHLHGGFGAWKAAGAPVAEHVARTPRPAKAD